MLWTRLTSHDSMAPYFPVPWSLGTSLPAFAQTPSPDSHGPSASHEQCSSPEPLERRWPHAPTHLNTPFSAPPSPCSSSLFLGANSAPTPPSALQLAPGRLTEARVASTSSGTAKTSVRLQQKSVGAIVRCPLPRVFRRSLQNVASTARERVLCADDKEEVYGRDGGAAVAAGSLLLQALLNIAGPPLGNVDSACGSVDNSDDGGGGIDETCRALIAGFVS